MKPQSSDKNSAIGLRVSLILLLLAGWWQQCCALPQLDAMAMAAESAVHGEATAHPASHEAMICCDQSLSDDDCERGDVSVCLIASESPPLNDDEAASPPAAHWAVHQIHSHAAARAPPPEAAVQWSYQLSHQYDSTRHYGHYLE
ncbi:MAG: hypothetical protein Tsb002_22170 [Wenzhouxiangellaceae bacterium]